MPPTRVSLRLARVTGYIGLSFLLLIGVHASGLADESSKLTFKTGIGYEFLSQEFFLDSLDLSGSDTLETITALKTTYLDDIKAQFSMRFQPHGDRNLEFRADYDQTPDLIRVRLASSYRPTLGSVKADLDGQLDWREAYGDGADATDSYVFGYGRAKFVLPTTSRSTLHCQFRGDFVRFDSVAAPSFNHFRLGVNTGYNLYFADFSTFGVSGFLQGRKVPDTSYLDYLSYGLESTLLAFYGSKGELDAYVRLEVKDYNQPPEEDDYIRFEADLRHQVGISDVFVARQELKSEVIVFDQSDALNSDYSRIELNLLLGIDLTTFSAALGPHLEYQIEQESDEFSLGESYFENGLQANLDFINDSRAFVSLESVLGHRNLEQQADFLTNFTFERLNLLADWQIVGGLGLTALMSAEWEWHDNASENSRIVLLSTGLYYSF